ncbi:MAG: preprotein translocase subunit SecA [Eggerthellaceae bacterium]|nr:preprotein translocase subunit SecA [Eggerthellaceae bacterium]
MNKVLSAGEGRQMKKYLANVDKINALEQEISAFSDEELRAQTDKFRERLENGDKLDDLLCEAFGTVREASKRTTGLRHFDVQLIGGMVLHESKIAEMKTGEGKTLVSTLAGYLNALGGENVHIVTVNDYLAERDSKWMGRIYKFLGMEVGLIQNNMFSNARNLAYQADVTYGTNSEFGFDYLRDNMVTKAEQRVQRGHYFAIVDEVDSILIDEARTPLIISGAGTEAAETYKQFARVMPGLVQDVDFDIDEAKHTIIATETGLAKIEKMLGIEDIYDDPTCELPNHLQQALRAQFLFHRDVNYVLVDGEVKIVDEFTGRIMEGRRYSEGLHQAIEAKEHVEIREENQTLAAITLQNYFRLYDKLSGMTGTAMTEDTEFRTIYNLPVVAIPPNVPVIRVDKNDLIYRTINAKLNAVADEIEERHARQQPVLVGTVSIESSERLSCLLNKRGIKHEILNAKNHCREALIVAQAGRAGAVTIATNMAGRGTDILLGGNPEIMMDEFIRAKGYDPSISWKDWEEMGEEQRGEATPPADKELREEALTEAMKICKEEKKIVINAGGLSVIGTERHESRRIDNQLRGRSGRQGDPGTTQFYFSLEDDLMRLFAGDRMDYIAKMMVKSDIPEDMPIQANMVTKAVESAQRKVETMHFAARKNILEYDDVMNLQRKAIYEERNSILDGKDLGEKVPEIIDDAAKEQVLLHCSGESSEDWCVASLNSWAFEMTGKHDFDAAGFAEDEEPMDVLKGLKEFLEYTYETKRTELGPEIMNLLQSHVMLRIIDTRWMAHLTSMDYLKQGIGLRVYGQRDPLVEYKEEAYNAFKELTSSMYVDFLRTVLRLQMAIPTSEQKEEEKTARNMSYSNLEQNLEAREKSSLLPPAFVNGMPGQAVKFYQSSKTYVKDKDDPFVNVGRNDSCPCGSGKKYKKCHGA